MAASRGAIPGNFRKFDFLIQFEIKGAVHLGRPAICLHVSGQERWASEIEWLIPSDDQTRIPWVDDEANGLAKRNLKQPSDALGAEGLVDGARVRFERILDLGDNIVVFALYFPDLDMRVACGFDRDVFEPGIAI